jgi:hypothetical protein
MIIQPVDGEGRTFVNYFIPEVVLFSALRRQYTASKQQLFAADNEDMWIFSPTLIEILLPS